LLAHLPPQDSLQAAFQMLHCPLLKFAFGLCQANP
jgi:hypothetical protein